jgi:hypothetical protein
MGVLLQQCPDHVREGLKKVFGTDIVQFIIDGFEVRTQKPEDEKTAMLWWSDYKGAYTVKYLLGICIVGALTFVSEAFPGRITDNSLVGACRFRDMLDYGVVVVTDKGFNCHYDFHEVGAQQAVPPKKHAVNEKGIVASAHGRLTTDEVEDTKDIAAVRIFVEHAVRRMKEFRIFASVRPITGNELLSVAGFVVMCLVNVTTTTIDLFPKPKARDD